MSLYVRNTLRMWSVWVLIVCGIVIGCAFAWSFQPLVWRIVGGILLLASVSALGFWFVWVCRIAVHERTFVRCDNCGHSGPGVGHRR